MHEMEHDLLHLGLEAFKAGERSQARNYFERVCWLAPSQDDLVTAQFYLSELEDDPQKKRSLLENVLVVDPLHPEARRSLAVLDGRLTPEQAAAQPEEPAPGDATPAHARRYVCRQCGGRMRFSPEGVYLLCDYCHTRVTLAQELKRNQSDRQEDFTVALAQAKGHLPPIAIHSVSCPGCGASFALAEAALSFRCPFCSSTLVLETSSIKEWIPPHAILTFSLSREQAFSAMKSWLSDRWSKQSVKILSMENVYLPAWSFDIAGQMSYINPEEQGSKTTWPIHYTRVLVSACHSLPVTLAGIVSSFRLQDAKPYAPAMLAGWPTEMYQVAPAEASLAAREQVLREERKTAPRSPHGFLSTADVYVDTFQQYLLPVWFGRFQAGKLELRTVVNGQSGLVFGELRRQTGLLSRILGNP